MKTITVWRIEDQDGIGPYRSKHKEVSRSLMSFVDAPIDFAYAGYKSFNKRRFKKMCKKGWKFAWTTENAAIKHCNGNIRQLNELGFSIKQQTTKKYRIFPDNQVMYCKGE